MNGGAPPLQTSSSTSSTSTNVPLVVNRGKKRVALQDRDLEMLSLPSQDEPSYYDSPPNSPPPPSSSSSLAYPTSLIRLSTSSSSTVKVSNRGNKLDPSAPFLNPLKLGHHSQLATTDESCLKKRKLNDLSSSSTKDGFLICPNLQLLPKKTIIGIGGSKDAELYRDGTSSTGGGGFPSFLPLPPQSPLDLILLPHIQYTFSSNSSKNKTFHLLSESCTRLIEQESELVANLKKVCSGLRGEGFEWRWIGDDTREIERRNRRELRDKNLELERVEREKLRKQERDKVLKERKERKEREKLEREERQRIAAEQEAEEQKKKEQERREEEEEESRKRQQQQDSIVKPEPDQTPTIQPAQPVSGAQYAQGLPLNDVEMNDSSSSSSIPTPSTLLTTMPTPSSLPSLPLPPAPPQQQEQEQEEEEDTPMSISNENTSLAPTNPLSQPPQTSISSTAIENVINNGETKEEEEGGTSTTTSVSSQQQPPMERVEEGQIVSETTTNPLPPRPSSPVPHAPSTEVTYTKDSTPVASTTTTTTENQQPEQQQAVETTTESQPAAETITPAQVQEQEQEQDSQPEPAQTELSNEVVDTEPEPEPEPTAVEPSIRRSGRQTRATVGLRASQLLFEDGGSVASNSLVGGGGRGMSYSPDPYGLAITGGNNNSRFGGVGGHHHHHHQTEEVESDSTPRSSNNGNRGQQQQQQQQQQQRREDQEEEEESDLEGFEREEEGEEELPLIPEEDIPEYAHRLIDPEKYVKQLFVSDEPVELEKTAFGNCGAVEILSRNEQEALVHECLTDLHRFLSDTLEYRDRLSEIRDGVLEVERRRKGMWKVVRTVALDWLEEEAAGGGIGGAGTNGVNGAGTATGYEGYE
ncbi:hypothetical protein JCM3765_000417 [Sporobolomyces pararoseus]